MTYPETYKDVSSRGPRRHSVSVVDMKSLQRLNDQMESIAAFKNKNFTQMSRQESTCTNVISLHPPTSFHKTTIENGLLNDNIMTKEELQHQGKCDSSLNKEQSHVYPRNRIVKMDRRSKFIVENTIPRSITVELKNNCVQFRCDSRDDAMPSTGSHNSATSSHEDSISIDTSQERLERAINSIRPAGKTHFHPCRRSSEGAIDTVNRADEAYFYPCRRSSDEAIDTITQTKKDHINTYRRSSEGAIDSVIRKDRFDTYRRSLEEAVDSITHENHYDPWRRCAEEANDSVDRKDECNRSQRYSVGQIDSVPRVDTVAALTNTNEGQQAVLGEQEQQGIYISRFTLFILCLMYLPSMLFAGALGFTLQLLIFPDTRSIAANTEMEKPYKVTSNNIVFPSSITPYIPTQQPIPHSTPPDPHSLSVEETIT